MLRNKSDLLYSLKKDKADVTRQWLWSKPQAPNYDISLDMKSRVNTATQARSAAAVGKRKKKVILV